MPRRTISTVGLGTPTIPPTPSPPATPRPSASLVVINQRNEVLMVHRNPKARSFGGVHVFPGGNYDAKQDTSLQVTAIRETFEETGLLLASPPQFTQSQSQSDWDQARHAIHSGRLLFSGFMDKYNLKPGTDSLLPFTEWTTPATVPRRFRTQFFVAFLPSSSAFSSGAKEERLPTSDGGQEVISARFLHPGDVLAEFRQKLIILMPPQFYILSTLSPILVGSLNTREQRRQVMKLSQGAFGRLSFNPRRLRLGSEKDGRTALTYEGDETRGGPLGRLHRSLVKFEQGGVTSEIELQRNFDIFSDLDSEYIPSKL